MYLLKPSLVKAEELEKRLAAIPSNEAYEEKIAHLEALLEEHELSAKLPRKVTQLLMEIGCYLIIPLALLLLSHALITIVYDTKILYLRIISMLLPLPFGYFLFKSHPRSVFPWFVGVVAMSIATVIGMSAITTAVDGSPIFPQNNFEWKELLEYSSSIAFSFLTGMLLGGMAYASKHRRKSLARLSLLGNLISLFSSEKISPDKMHKMH
ncbi:MAG TPA: hypothetical protein DCW35_02230, partial [Polynucleobacter sp.]|nr:hypothetical protein [Polynucleobacter sp.]